MLISFPYSFLLVSTLRPKNNERQYVIICESSEQNILKVGYSVDFV
jgi:hypothetical protein